jgi:hypothetical protein
MNPGKIRLSPLPPTLWREGIRGAIRRYLGLHFLRAERGFFLPRLPSVGICRDLERMFAKKVLV